MINTTEQTFAHQPHRNSQSHNKQKIKKIFVLCTWVAYIHCVWKITKMWKRKANLSFFLKREKFFILRAHFCPFVMKGDNDNIQNYPFWFKINCVFSCFPLIFCLTEKNSEMVCLCLIDFWGPGCKISTRTFTNTLNKRFRH